MRKGTDKAVGLGLVALLPLCCLALPLLAAASISVAALAWGGALLGALVALAAFSVVLLRRRQRAGAARPAQPPAQAAKETAQRERGDAAGGRARPSGSVVPSERRDAEPIAASGGGRERRQA